MKISWNRHAILSGIISALLLASLIPLPAFPSTYYGHTSYQHKHPVKAYFHRHPYQKSALVGAGIGVAGGAILGGKKGAIKGGILGGGAGLGYQFLKQKGKL